MSATGLVEVLNSTTVLATGGNAHESQRGWPLVILDVVVVSLSLAALGVKLICGRMCGRFFNNYSSINGRYGFVLRDSVPSICELAVFLYFVIGPLGLLYAYIVSQCEYCYASSATPASSVPSH